MLHYKYILYLKEIYLLQNSTNTVWKDHLGRWHVRSLFLEMSSHIKATIHPLYTLNNEDIEKDGKVYKSLKKLYMEYPHVVGYEYDFACEYLGGWEHWVRLVDSSLRAHFKQWREELEVKQKAKALKGIILQSLDSTPTAFQAGKYLVEEGWVEKKGRPKKVDVERAAKIEAGVKEELSDDLERIGLKAVK